MIRCAREGGKSICKVVHHDSVIGGIVTCNAENLWVNGESVSESCPPGRLLTLSDIQKSSRTFANVAASCSPV